MNAEKIREVKYIYAEKLHNNKDYNDKYPNIPFFTRIIRKLDKKF